MKKIITMLGALALILGFAFAVPVMAQATENPGVCTGLDSGKIDTPSGPKTVTVTAPEGYLIDGYCVKAGSIKKGNGPVYVAVAPAKASVTFGYPNGKDISHYSVSYVPKPTPTPTVTEQCADETCESETPTPTPTETTPTPTPTETTSTPTPTESTPTSTPSTPASTPPPTLPKTGAPAPLLAGLGALLAAIGSGALWLTRKPGLHE